MHTGFGLRQPHADEAFALTPPQQAAAFVEVHSENHFGDGGPLVQMLLAARERWPVSLHGVGLALGSAAGVDATHVQRLARLVQRVEPVRVSDHAAFARAPRRQGGPVLHAADLLPVAFTDEALAVMATNVQQVQEALRRPLLVENLSAYLHWRDDRLDEPEFFNELARRTGCGMLLDLNNLVVNALNEPGADEASAAAVACRWVDRIDPGIVGEIHLAGYIDTGDLVIDDHGSRVHPPVWQVFEHACRRLGPRPTLIEWDTSLPPLSVLLNEVQQAEAVIAACCAETA